MALPTTRSLTSTASPTVRDQAGNIYEDMGGAQLRRIANIDDYQKGVSEGKWSGAPRQLATNAAPGAGGQDYLGGYSTGASTGATAFKDSVSNLIKTGSLAGAAPTRTDQISTLRQKAADLDTQAFERATDFTPSNLTPSQQAQLRRSRVLALSGEKGNYLAAIETLKTEEAAAKSEEEKKYNRALDIMNSYLEYGVFDQLTSEEQTALATTVGMSEAALKKISSAAANKPQELKEFNGNLYSITYDDKGKPVMTLVMAAAAKASGGGGGGSSATTSKYDSLAESFLLDGKTAADVYAAYTDPAEASAIIAAMNRISAAAGAPTSDSTSMTTEDTTTKKTPAEVVAGLQSVSTVEGEKPASWWERITASAKAAREANAKLSGASGGNILYR